MEAGLLHGDGVSLKELPNHGPIKNYVDWVARGRA